MLHVVSSVHSVSQSVSQVFTSLIIYLLFAAVGMYFVLCCQVEFSATGRSLVQGSPTECGVSKYDCKASILGDPGPLEAVASKKKVIYLFS